VTCPRCEKSVAIRSATVGLDLSCGCTWYAPSKGRPRDAGAWLMYEHRGPSPVINAATHPVAEQWDHPS
jgi:hypothetical protein